MNKKILIHNDNGRRDLLGLKLLGKALTAKGLEVYFAGRTTLKARVRQIRPNALIMARGDNEVAKMASAVCDVYILPGEGGRTTKETMLSVFLGRGYSAFAAADWIKRCYLWNENTKRWLLETDMLTPTQMKVVGNPRLDIYRRSNYRNLVKSRVDGEPLRIGIAFSATTTSQIWGPPHFAEGYFNSEKGRIFPIVPPGRNLEDIIWRDHSILRNMMNLVEAIGEGTTHEMILRPNPLEAISEYQFLEKKYPGRFKVLYKESLPEFLSKIDVLITCWSTTGIEALLNGIPVITISGFMNQERLFDHIAKRASGFDGFVQHYHAPKGTDELLGLLELAEQDRLKPSPQPPEETAAMIKEIYGWMEDAPNSCDLIAEDIANDLGSSHYQNTRGDNWREALPLRFNLPPSLIGLGINLRDVFKAIRSGEFRSYMTFLRCSDSYVDQIIQKADRA